MNKVAQFTNVYGSPSNFPPVFDFHIYGNQCPGLTGGQYTAQQEFSGLWQRLNALGWTQGWVIGETCNNDATTAQELQAALLSSGNTVFYIQQWPSAVTPSVPIAYNNWAAYGW